MEIEKIRRYWHYIWWAHWKIQGGFQWGAPRYIPFLNIMNNVIIDPVNLGFVRISPSEGQHQTVKGDLFFNGSSETSEELGMCSVLLEDMQNVYLNSFCFGFRLHKPQEVYGLYLEGIAKRFECSRIEKCPMVDLTLTLRFFNSRELKSFFKR